LAAIAAKMPIFGLEGLTEIGGKEGLIGDLKQTLG